MVHKFKNARQERTGRNMVKSSSPNAPSTWLIFLCPRTHASPQTCHHSASSVLAVRISCRVIAVFVFRKPLFTIIMAPKRKSSDAGSASRKSKRSRAVLSISDKVKIMDTFEKEKKKNRMRRLPGCMARTSLPFVKWWRTKKKIHASFSVAPQTTNVTAIARDKVLMKIEKALNFWLKIWIERGYTSLLHFIVTLLNVGNVLLYVIYQLTLWRRNYFFFNFSTSHI